MRGEGFAIDKKVKSAVEAHAMDWAREYCEALGKVRNTARSPKLGL
jgi:hypothetical protein